jgi:predicted metalloprotease
MKLHICRCVRKGNYNLLAVVRKDFIEPDVQIQEGELNMATEGIRATLKFLAKEKNMISSFGIQEELFLPFLLSLKSGGSWSYASEEAKSAAIRDVITYYNEESKTGYILEKIYFFIDPVIINEEGVVCRLEKCGTKEERELVERPYSITLQAKKIIFAEVNPCLKKIRIRELEKKRILLEDIRHTVQLTSWSILKGEK